MLQIDARDEEVLAEGVVALAPSLERGVDPGDTSIIFGVSDHSGPSRSARPALGLAS